MAQGDEVVWKGRKGEYTYYCYSINTEFSDKPGNYIFAKITANHWTPVYIGQTKSLKDRLENHEKEPWAIRSGATHIMAHQTSSEVDRLAEEADLIKTFQPTCNEQLL